MKFGKRILDDERKEEILVDFIQQLSKYPKVLGDYQKWLNEEVLDTSDMRTMGASESTIPYLRGD